LSARWLADVFGVVKKRGAKAVGFNHWTISCSRAHSPTYAVVRVIYLGVAEPMVGHNSPLAPNDSLITRPAAAAVAAKLLGAK